MYFIPGKIEFLNEGGYLNIKKIKSHVTNLEREQTEREISAKRFLRIYGVLQFVPVKHSSRCFIDINKKKKGGI